MLVGRLTSERSSQIRALFSRKECECLVSLGENPETRPKPGWRPASLLRTRFEAMEGANPRREIDLDVRDCSRQETRYCKF
jgi:hypothetical protein